MDFEVMKAYLPRFWDALLLTLRIGWRAWRWALAPGRCLQRMRYIGKFPLLRQIVGGYIVCSATRRCWCSCFSCTFALPKIGVRISAETCGKLGLGLLGGAYMAETFRSGLENIPIIQTESAQSLGLRPAQVFGYVILPQAVTSSVPGLLANLIFLLKETSVFSTISLMDLMFTAKDLIGMYAKTIECLTLLVAFYLIMLLPVSILGSWLERRLRYAEFGN